MNLKLLLLGCFILVSVSGLALSETTTPEQITTTTTQTTSTTTTTNTQPIPFLNLDPVIQSYCGLVS